MSGKKEKRQPERHTHQTSHSGHREQQFVHYECKDKNLKAEYYVVSSPLLGTTEVSFQLPYLDWLKLEGSEIWSNLDEFLAEAQSTNTRIPRQDPLSESGTALYKNLLSWSVLSVYEHLKQLFEAIFRRKK